MIYNTADVKKRTDATSQAIPIGLEIGRLNSVIFAISNALTKPKRWIRP
jgi:hypothetical protein